MELRKSIYFQKHKKLTFLVGNAYNGVISFIVPVTRIFFPLFFGVGEKASNDIVLNI